MNIDSDVKEIGVRLAEFAMEKAEFTAQRGLVEQLFPFISDASKRMSTRAISRYLEENEGVKLSAVTIAKALREEDKYWEQIADDIEPAARIVGQAHALSVRQVLLLENFLSLQDETPTVAGDVGLEEYHAAYSEIATGWAVLSDAAREQCLRFISRDSSESNSEEANEGPTGKK